MCLKRTKIKEAGVGRLINSNKLKWWDVIIIFQWNWCMAMFPWRLTVVLIWLFMSFYLSRLLQRSILCSIQGTYSNYLCFIRKSKTKEKVLCKKNRRTEPKIKLFKAVAPIFWVFKSLKLRNQLLISVAFREPTLIQSFQLLLSFRKFEFEKEHRFLVCWVANPRTL